MRWQRPLQRNHDMDSLHQFFLPHPKTLAMGYAEHLVAVGTEVHIAAAEGAAELTEPDLVNGL